MLIYAAGSEGKVGEVEREKIEEQVAIYVRSCTANIRKLEVLIQRKEQITPQAHAYQCGVVSTQSSLSILEPLLFNLHTVSFNFQQIDQHP